MPEYEFHLLANAHLDPVWLWGWQEGLNEAITTTRTMLDLMDEDDEFAFMRGESVLYEHIEKYDPETFERIGRYVKQGRWDIVGGTYLQSDMNMPGTETFARHFCVAQNYFMSRFGKRVRVAWAADAFGHSAGLPSIMAAAGIEGFSFSRPSTYQYPLPKPAFWWEGPDGSRVLAYRPTHMAYCCSRDAMPRILDNALKNARNCDLKTIGVLYGLGNHGGGSTRRMLKDIKKWAAAHPEVRIVHSGLHRFFKRLRGEIGKKDKGFVPVHRGELNFVLRGCYSSASDFKKKYREAEAMAARSERVYTGIRSMLSPSVEAERVLKDAWKAVLFNSFHDILPGTSIERAYDEQIDWVGGAIHETRKIELHAIDELSMQVDTSVARTASDHPSATAFMVFNPHPYEYRGPIELEASLDYRPIPEYRGRAMEVPLEVLGPDRKPVPWQMIETENDAVPELLLRSRIVTDATLPPMGWSVFTLGWVENPAAVSGRGMPASARGDNSISNRFYRVSARKGSVGIDVRHKGKALFGKDLLSLATVKDPYGSWGKQCPLDDDPSFTEVLHRWRVDDVRVVENGPERSAMWVTLKGGNSTMEFVFTLMRGMERVDILARLLWNQESARLKLLMPVKGWWVECAVPGGSIRRREVGEMPGGRWTRIRGENADLGLVSDLLYSYDLKDGVFSATITRSANYAKTSAEGCDPENGLWQPGPWKPIMDQGLLRFRFALMPGRHNLERAADELEQPPLVVNVPPKKASLPRAGSIMKIAPDNIRLLAFKPAEKGRDSILRVQETSGKDASVKVMLCGKTMRLGKIRSRSVATYRLTRTKGLWKSKRVDIVEKP